MKTKFNIAVVLTLLFAVNVGNAQFLKKLKEKVMGKEEVVPTQKLSDNTMKFKGWNMGEANIMAISVFSDDFEKHRTQVGTIAEDGSFDLNLPDSLKTWIPVSVYGKDCENANEARITNPETKMAWNRFFVFKDGEFIGSVMPANPVKAAYNLNDGGVNNGRLGKYYLHVYVDGNASASIDCTKKQDITDGKDATYEDFPLKDNFDLHYKKGWNIVEVHNLDNIWLGLTKHYQERSWKVVEEVPDSATWVFRPRTNKE